MADMVERVNVKQAAKELKMDMESLRHLMEKRELPIGYVTKKEGCKRRSFIIYRGLLDSYKKQIQ